MPLTSKLGYIQENKYPGFFSAELLNLGSCRRILTCDFPSNFFNETFQLNLNDFSKLVFRKCLTQAIRRLVNFLNSSYTYNSNSVLFSENRKSGSRIMVDGDVSEGESQ